MKESIDNLVIGGGIYGTSVALALTEELPDQKTILVESEPILLDRASTNNHGRLHAGYQYPNSPETAKEAKLCRARFIEEYGDCVDSNTALYAIHRDSSVSPDQYEEFCKDVGLELELPDTEEKALFGGEVISVFRIYEQTFSSEALRRRVLDRVASSELEVLTNSPVEYLFSENGAIQARIRNAGLYAAKRVFNCTYSGVNLVHSDMGVPSVATVNEKYLLFGMQMPQDLADTTVTVAYGPFSSFVVNRRAGSHVFAHVIESNIESKLNLPPERADIIDAEEIFIRSVEQSRGYLPILSEARYTGRDVKEIKSFVGKDSTENAQGCRSSVILEDYGGVEGYHVIFGGKVTGFYRAAEFAVRRAAGEGKTVFLTKGCSAEISAA